MKNKILSPVLNMSGPSIHKVLWSTTIVLHIALIPIFLGIWSTIPSYVQVFSNWIHLVVGLYLVIRFRPYQTQVDFHHYDRAFVFSAGLFMLEALFASSLLASPWGKEITAYMLTWGSWVRELPFFAPFVSQTKSSTKTPTEDTNDSIAPNLSTSSLGGSSYSLEV
jgi:hypothetical protein